MKVVHVTVGLEPGGSERMLVKLLPGLSNRHAHNVVVSLTTPGPLSEPLHDAGIQVIPLGLSKTFPIAGFSRLVNFLRDQAPDIAHCWMYHANLFGGLAARAARVPSVVWSVRHTDLTRHSLKPSTLVVARAGGLLSSTLPSRILFNATASLREHSRLGYSEGLSMVIPNGFDTTAFRKDAVAYASLRRELDLHPETRLVGLIGRMDVAKDHPTFLRAAALVRERLPGTHFLLAGTGITRDTPELWAQVLKHSLAPSTHLLGYRADVPRITAGLDVAVSSSTTEAFANVIGEAMACEVPCVVTAVGDSQAIVGDTGRVVPSGLPDALAEAIVELLELPERDRRELGHRARDRVSQLYSLEAITDRTFALYEELLRARRPSGP
ncbi:MAG: glycosyltransferase [bacterium]|nr:glycosyltransferase [bacterium]